MVSKCDHHQIDFVCFNSEKMKLPFNTMYKMKKEGKHNNKKRSQSFF